jgi:hypothetical protein
VDLNENLIRLRHWPRNISERDVVTFAIVFDNEPIVEHDHVMLGGEAVDDPWVPIVHHGRETQIRRRQQ